MYSHTASSSARDADSPHTCTSPHLMMEQLMPTYSWGQTYLVPYFSSASAALRVVALEAATTVNCKSGTGSNNNPGIQKSNELLNPGDNFLYTAQQTAPIAVEANKAVIVVVTYFFTQIGAGGGDYGYSQVVPLQQSSFKVFMPTPQNYQYQIAVAFQDNCGYSVSWWKAIVVV